MYPYIIFHAAMGLDGRISRKNDEILFLDELYRDKIYSLRESVDAIMLDVDTIRNENPEILVRRDAKAPIRIIVDNKAEVPFTANALKGDVKKILVVSKSAQDSKIYKLKNNVMNLEIIISGDYVANLNDVMRGLYQRGMERILLEGGEDLSRRMFEEGFVSEAYFTIAPVLSSYEGITLFNNRRINSSIKLRLEGILQFGDQVMLHYMMK